jgi:hypothetical protein
MRHHQFTMVVLAEHLLLVAILSMPVGRADVISNRRSVM